MCAEDGGSAVASGRKRAGRHNNIHDARYRARDASKNPLNRIVLDNLLEFKERLKEPPSPAPVRNKRAGKVQRVRRHAVRRRALPLPRLRP